MRQRTDMYRYQNRAVEFVKRMRKCLLFLDMGLGKTTIILTALSELLDEFEINRVLIIAPLRVANTVWKQEAQNWEHLKHLDIGIATGNSRLKVLKECHQITVINREMIPWLIENGLWDFGTVIIDESTSFKSHKSARFKALKSVLPKAHNLVCLTGTPSPQGMIDLWAQVYLVDRGERLGRNITTFTRRYYDQGGFNGFTLIPKEHAQDEIQDKLKDICLTMTSDDYLDLPEAIPLEYPVVLPDAAAKQYKLMKKELLLTLENGDDVMSPTASTLSNKLLQICNGAIYDADGKWHEIHDAKIQALKDLVEDNPNENILVGYNFKSDLERLKKAFPNAVVLDKSGHAVEKWNKGEIKMLLAHPASAGHGLNMQFGGSTMVYFGLMWSLELYQQFNKRLHRNGQKSTVKIIHLVAKGCVDEKVMKALSDKDASQQKLIDSLKKYYQS